MVANAAITHHGPIVESELPQVISLGFIIYYSICAVDVEKWDKVYSINVRGVMLCYKHAAKQMIAQGQGGRIIGDFVTLSFTFHDFSQYELLRIGAASVASKTGMCIAYKAHTLGYEWHDLDLFCLNSPRSPHQMQDKRRRLSIPLQSLLYADSRRVPVRVQAF